MKKILAMMLALVMVFALCACSSSAPAASGTTAAPAEQTQSEPAADSSAADSDLAYVQANGKLVVGITDFEPMDYLDANGEWIGFDADMAKAFAESIGVEAEFIEINWDNKVLELNGKSIDCVWNGCGERSYGLPGALLQQRPGRSGKGRGSRSVPDPGEPCGSDLRGGGGFCRR